MDWLAPDGEHVDDSCQAGVCKARARGVAPRPPYGRF